MKVFGQLEKAQLENLTADPTGAGLVPGIVWYRTDQKLFKVYDGAVVQTFVDLNTAQTLSNKILASPEVTGNILLNQTTTPATPAAGKNRLYAKADNKLYTLDSAGNEAAVGSGGGSGVTNLITNGNADDTAATIFVPYADTGTRPVDGTGGVPTVTSSVSSTSPLNGLKSYLLTKPASNVQGQGWAVPFTVDLAYRAKSLKISADFIVNSGTFVAGTSTTDGDLIWYIYDVTNSALIAPSNIKMFSSSTTISDKFEATFQTSVSGASYRLIAHCASTSALAYEIKIDNVTVSPQVYVYGSPVTDWQPYTPTFTGLGTVVVSDSYWRRVGDSIYIRGRMALGTTTASTASISLPNGYLTDDTDFTIQSTVEGNITNNSTATNFLAVAAPGQDHVAFANAASSGLSKMLGTAVGSSGQAVGYAIGPITIKGLSSSVQMSDSADTRVVAMHTMKNTAQSIPSGVNTAITGWVSSGVYYNDTHGSFNATTGEYTVRVPGFYDIFSTVDFVANATGYRYAGLSISGPSGGIIFGTALPGFAADSLRASVQATRYLDIGAVILVFGFQNSGGALNTRAGLDGGSIFTVKRVTGPSAIAASEKIAFAMGHNSGQAISAGVSTTMICTLKEYDSHNIYNTANGNFSFPRPGFVNLFARFLSQNIAAGATQYYGQLALIKNGSTYKIFSGRYNVGAGTTTYAIGEGGVGFYSLPTDVWRIEAYYPVATAVLADSGQSFITAEMV